MHVTLGYLKLKVAKMFLSQKYEKVARNTKLTKLIVAKVAKKVAKVTKVAMKQK